MITATLFDVQNKEILEILEWPKPGIRFNKKHLKAILEFAQYHAERGRTVNISIETDYTITLGISLFYMETNRVQIIYRTNLNPVTSVRISKGE